MLIRVVTALLVAGFLAFASPPASGEPSSSGAPAIRISHFSGKPVPRFEQLKASEVNGRAGPSVQHPVLWQYARRGLPVLIVKETISWRQVRDPDGDEVWIHASLLTGGTSVLVTGDVVLRRLPDTEAGAVLRAEAGVIADVSTCEKGWCQLRLSGSRGWVPEASLWGANVPGAPL